jgi:hypothetical protein
MSDEEYLEWVEETLIPDFRESGHDSTADDLQKLVDMARKYMGVLDRLVL